MPRALEEILQQARVAELRLESGQPVSSDTPISTVYEILDRERRNAVVVCDGDKVTGIFTHRDVLYRTALEAPDPETPVGEVMTPAPFTMRPRQRLAEAIREMTRRGHRSVPLVDENGCWVGLISSRNVLRYVAEHFPEAVLNLPPRLHQQLPTPEGG